MDGPAHFPLRLDTNLTERSENETHAAILYTGHAISGNKPPSHNTIKAKSNSKRKSRPVNYILAGVIHRHVRDAVRLSVRRGPRARLHLVNGDENGVQGQHVRRQQVTRGRERMLRMAVEQNECCFASYSSLYMSILLLLLEK